MSDVSQGPGWWMASDGKWYPPESAPGWTAAAPTFPAPTFPAPAAAPAGFPEAGDSAPVGFPTPGAPSFPTPGAPSFPPPDAPSAPVAPPYEPAAFGSPPAGLAMPAPSYGPPAAPGFPAQGFPAPGFPPNPGFPAPGFPPNPGFPQGPGYAAPGFPGGAGPVKQSNGLAIGALILGILAILTGWIFIGAAFGIVGLILGFLGLKKSKSIGSGKGLAIAGIVLSILGILSAVAVGVLVKKVVDKVDVADPTSYSMVTTSCSVTGDQLSASGEITNRTSDAKTLIILIDAGTTSAQTFVSLDANATAPWSIEQPVTGATGCGKTTVRNFFDINLNS